MCETSDGYVDQLRSMLDGAVPPAIIRQIEASVEPVLYLIQSDDETKAPGRTRTGGVPDLPQGLDWPRMTPLAEGDVMPAPWDGWDRDEAIRQRAAQRPYSFLAQVELADVAPFAPAQGRLPDTGRLYFFYSFETLDIGQWTGRVVWDDTPSEALSPAIVPPELRELHKSELAEIARLDQNFSRDQGDRGEPASRFIFPPMPLAPVDGFGVPDRAALEAEVYGINVLLEDENHSLQIEEAIDDLWNTCFDEDMAINATLAHGIIPEQDDPRRTAAAMTGTSPGDWSFLFQVHLALASDEAFAEGAVYFVIPTEDLRQHRFDRVHVEFQQT